MLVTRPYCTPSPRPRSNDTVLPNHFCRSCPISTCIRATTRRCCFIFPCLPIAVHLPNTLFKHQLFYAHANQPAATDPDDSPTSRAPAERAAAHSSHTLPPPL